MMKGKSKNHNVQICCHFLLIFLIEILAILTIKSVEENVQYSRLTWEGRSDKMAQGFKLCLLNYEFHILDNAFLIHKPGIKTKNEVKTSLKKKKITAQNTYLKKTILPEIKRIYGARKGCEMF